MSVALELPIPELIDSNGVDKILYVMTEFGCVGWVSFHLQLTGRLDETVLQKALELSMHAEPILGCEFAVNGKRPHWKRLKEIDGSRNLTVVQTESPEQLATRQAVAPFDFNAPVFRAFIYRSAGRPDYLLFQASHFLADAYAAFQILTLVAKSYSDLMAGAQSVAVTPQRRAYDWDFPLYHQFGSKDKFRLFREAITYPLTQMAEAKKVSRCFRSDPAEALNLTSAGEASLVRETIGQGEFTKIKSAAFKSQCWVHDAIMAAFLRAFAELAPTVPNDRHRAGAVVNLRRHLPEGYTAPICNLIHQHIVDVGSDLGSDFHETLARVKKANVSLDDPVYTLRDRPIAFRLMGLASLAGIRKLIKKGLAQNCKTGAPPTVSNVGSLDHRAVRFADIEAEDFFVTGHPTRLPGFLPIVSEFRGSCSWTVSFFPSEIAPERVKEMFGRMRAELLTFAEGQRP